jgi:hypothetical protein
LTARYNRGRWAGILAEEPADGLWTSYRQQAPLLPAAGLGGSAPDALRDLAVAGADLAPVPVASAAAPLLRVTADDGWRRVPGLGRGDGVLAAQGLGATLTLQVPATGAACLRVHVLPTYPRATGEPWQADVLVDGQAHVLRWPRGAQDATWAQGVLANRLTASLTLPERGVGSTLQLRAQQPGLMFDGAELLPGACTP